MQAWRTNPFEEVVLPRAKGCTVWDDRGKAYLALLAGCWCTVLGHGHPRFVEAVRRQIDTFTHSGPPFLSDQIQSALASLAEILPPALDRAVFLNTGSEAVELALKMVRAATDADAVVVVERSFYGDTTYAFALSEAGRSAPWLPRVGNVTRLPAPQCERCPVGATWPCDNYGCLDDSRTLAAKGNQRVAAVIFEPVLANAGMIVPPPGYGARLRELAAKLGAFFIAEEVTTGMGRTGRWFAFDHDEMQPDILVLGKALGAGLPVAAVVTTADVEARAAGKDVHMQSHQNDPFSGNIVATVISILKEEGLVERASEVGDYVFAGLRDLQSRWACITNVRGRGLMVGIELEHDLAREGAEIARHLFESGFIVSYQLRNVSFCLCPPYVIRAEEIDAFLGAFDSALSRITE
jgi:4-aminobutyrate aminotransferase-like enzyme